MVAHAFRIFDAYDVDTQGVGTSTVTGSCGRATKAPQSCVPLPRVVGRMLEPDDRRPNSRVDLAHRRGVRMDRHRATQGSGA